jgi:uncharacterized protein (TIGR02284 family)
MPLSSEKIIEELNELIRLDHDAIGAYNEAIDGIDESRLRERLRRFCGDHVRHVADLTLIVRRLGGEPPAKPAARGLSRMTLTKVAGLDDPEVVLKVMRSNENVIQKYYGECCQQDFPEEIRDVIQRHFGDEQRHCSWMEQALRARIWELPASGPIV